MKIIELRKKIIINSSISGVALLVFCGTLFYNVHQSTQVQKRVDEMRNETNRIQGKTTELQSKIMDIKKYMSIWTNMADNKKSTSGIKMDDVNLLLNTIGTKYDIGDRSIKVALPEAMGDGTFNATTITVLSTTVNLTFTALSDVKALLFISEFANSLPGYVIISNFEIKKEKDYTNEDLVAISTGKSSGKVIGSVSFYWYAFRAKQSATPTPEPKAAPSPATPTPAPAVKTN